MGSLRQRKHNLENVELDAVSTKRAKTQEAPSTPQHEQHLEFGGPLGAFAVMVFSHTMPFFMLVSLNRHKGFLFVPSRDDWQWLTEHAVPTQEAISLYVAFLAAQLFLGYVAPGVVVAGNFLEKKFEIVQQSVADSSGCQKSTLKKKPLQLRYLVNSFAAWWVSLAVLFGLQFTGKYDLSRVYDIHGPLLAVAMIAGDVVSMTTHVVACRFQVTERMHGNFVYDYFMGVCLNPRIAVEDLLSLEMWKIVLLGSGTHPDTQENNTYIVGDKSLTVPSDKSRLITAPGCASTVLLQPGEIVCKQPKTIMDLKLWAEIKMSWLILFTLVLGAFFKERIVLGCTSNGMWLIMLAQGLYSNACMKGEHLVPTTWDITFEKWGWMLTFWNLAGVPFVYCFQSFYVAHKSIESHGACDLSTPVALALASFLLAMYLMWDNSNHQKNVLRAWQNGSHLSRATFPQFPPYKLWRTVPGLSAEAKQQDAANKEKSLTAWRKYPLGGWLFHLLTRTDYDFGAIVKDDYERIHVPAVYDTQGTQLFVTDPTTGRPVKPKTSDLLCDGWHKYLRKPHYVSDFAMTLIWGASTLGCGLAFLPFFYSIFFGGMIFHRWQRDEQHLAIKYGEAYTKTYKERVPYVFIPGIY